MIDGIKVVELVTHEDDRGYVTEVALRAVSPRVPEGVDAVVNVGGPVERSHHGVQPPGQPRD